MNALRRGHDVAACVAQSVQGERVIVMDKYQVGRTFERVHGDVTTEYRVESIELDTNESCEGNPLHTVHMVDTATGRKWYSYAVAAELDDGLARPVSVRPANWMYVAHFGVNATDIVGYAYGADIACPSCMRTNAALYAEQHGQTSAGMSLPELLAFWADREGINPEDESSYDSEDFPKVIFASQAGDEDSCGECGESLIG